jgi:hypothetical protein
VLAASFRKTEVRGPNPQYPLFRCRTVARTLRMDSSRELTMTTGVGRARIGQWYTRWDKGEIFQVVGYDPSSRTIETQTFDGDLDEVDLEAWGGLPLAFAEPPEDWTGPVDDVERDDLGYSETEMSGADWAEPMQSFRPEEGTGEKAAEEETTDEDEGTEDEGALREELALDHPIAAERLR